jgi:exosome complex exonuclease DIS3/RRP44
MLATSINWAPLPADIKDRAHTRDVIDQMNHRHRTAQLASRASTEVFTLIYFSNKQETAEAMVVAVKSNGVRVIVPKFGIENAITIVSKDMEAGRVPNPFVFDADAQSLTNTRTGKVFKIFDKFDVVISVKENKSRRRFLTIELAEGDSNQNNSNANANANSNANANANANIHADSTSAAGLSTSKKAKEVYSNKGSEKGNSNSNSNSNKSNSNKSSSKKPKL